MSVNMRSMKKQCVCGAGIRLDRCLCDSCSGLYGLNPINWPLWLSDWMGSYKKECNHENNHRDVSFDAYQDALECEKPDKPLTKLRGCRTESHLYQDRNNH